MPLENIPTRHEAQEATESPLHQGLGEIFGPSNSEDFSQQTQGSQQIDNGREDQNLTQPLLPSLEIENGSSEGGSGGNEGTDSGKAEKSEAKQGPKDGEDRKKDEGRKDTDAKENQIKSDGKKVPGVPPEAQHRELKS